MKPKLRADVLLVERGLAPSREQARRLIMAGLAVIGEQRVEKPGTLYDQALPARIKKSGQARYVSRGGDKLAAALRTWPIPVRNAVALDVGASTGGFTDCLLQHGVAKVFALDVGYGQLAWSLRQDPRVVNLERRNIRSFDPTELTEVPTLSVVDASFISLALVLPKISALIAPQGTILALVKPQFEVGKGKVGKRRGGPRPGPARRSLDTLARPNRNVEYCGEGTNGISTSRAKGE